MSLRPVRTLFALLLGGALLLPAASRAEPFDTVNPGVTLSYTFGRGFTYGLEVSWVRLPGTLEEFKENPYGLGVAVDLSTNFDGLFKARVAGEIVGPLVGVEMGPTLVVDRGEAHLGIGITPWAGYHVMPYYTYTLVFGGENLHELGAYAKLFLSAEGGGANGSAGDDWD